jgi:phage terminase large subunit-like protein
VTDRVTAHAYEVAEGKKPAGHLHRLACERHIENLERSGFEYHWEPEAAKRVIDFAETLTIVEGNKPKQLVLLDEQAFDIGARFGWKNERGFRRFRRSYKSVARQNGKTVENGIMGTYIGNFSGYKYGKLFTVATKKRQSKIAWEEMAKFIAADAELGELFEVKDYKSLITCKLTNCTIEALSKEAGLDDGFRSIFSSLDEIHQMKDNKIYKAIYNGTKALDETLVSMITTRGDNPNSFCKEIDDYAIKVLNGSATAEDFFIDIYTLDDKGDIWDESNWYKANPFLTTTEQGWKTLRQDAQTAKDMGGAELKDFLIKTLNMWSVNTDEQFVGIDRWKTCSSDRTLKDYKGAEVWVGLDLSSGGDLTTIHLEIDSAVPFMHSHSFMPRGRMMEHITGDIAPYDMWEQMELITVTGGESDFKNDYKFIIKYLDDLIKEYDLKVRGIGVDPHNADGILADLEKYGAPVLLVTQSARNLNDATVDVQLSVKGKQITYNRQSELLTWSVGNAMLVHNSFGEVKIDKMANKRTRRIDPVDAMIDARAVKLKVRNNEKADLTEHMNQYLELMNW